MFKNLIVYRLPPDWQPPALAALEDALALGHFVPCTATQPQSFGWVAPRGDKHAALVESIGGQLVLSLKHESKGVPASVVKERLDERLEKMEQETGRKPRGKEKRDLKEDIVFELLPHAFSKKSSTRLWLDPQARLLVIGSGSLKKGETVVTALAETFAKLGHALPLRLVQTQMSPSVAMAGWLRTREAPAGFTIDRECELKQPDDSKSTVRYVRHTLDIDEIGEHIGGGKVPTKLAMTWNSRVSFVLSDDMSLKKIELLDVVLEGQSSNDKDDGGFDADVALMTGELGQLLPELLEALGGEHVPDAAGVAANDAVVQARAAA
jgi:recombination associated protein RdgC